MLIMNAKDFLEKGLGDDVTKIHKNIVLELMDNYAKHVIELNFCTGKPIEFHKNTIGDLRETNQVINLLVDWVNS